MRHKIAPVLAIVVTIILALPFLARPAVSPDVTPRPLSLQSKTTVKTPPPMVSKKHPITDQVAEGGLWRTDSNFQPVFMLKNLLEVASSTVTPVLYMADGTEFDMAPVKLDASGVAMVNIKDALANAPAEIQSHISAYGSAGIKSQWVWQAVFGAIRNSDDVRGLLFQTHLEANANFTHDPLARQAQQVLESSWWKQDPDVTGYLTLTNTSLKPITVSVKITDNLASASAVQQYTITPHATTWIDFAPFWAKLPAGSAGGIEIAYTGAMRAITASGGMEDASKGYSHMLHFEVPDSVMTSEIAAHQPANLPDSMKQAQLTRPQINTYDSTGIMVGTQDADMQFPQGTVFSPYLVLRNTTANPLVVQLAANTMTASSPLDVSLGNITLAAFESRQVDIHSLLNASKLAGYNGYINLQSTFAGAPNDLFQESGSIDQSLNYVFEVPPHLEQTTGARSMNYWNTNGDTDTMFTLFNHGSTAQDVVLTLQHQEGKYEVTIHLEPHASVTISAGKLIRSGAPDRNGNIIPASIVQGSAKISGPTGSMKERFSVDVSTGIFNARTGTCSYACCYCDPIEELLMDPDSSSVAVGEEAYINVWCIDSFGRGDYCSWDAETWETDNSSVATVSAGTVTGVAVGGANVTAWVSVTGPSAWGGENCCGTYGCPDVVFGDSSPVTVIPTVAFTPEGLTFIFVGSDPSVTGYNLQQVIGTPTGGTYNWTGPSGVSFSPNNSTSADVVTVTSGTASTGIGDTTLTVNYTVDGTAAPTPATKAITVRAFKFVTQTSMVSNGIPANSFGYSYSVTYNCNMAPGGATLLSLGNFTGIPVGETITTVSSNVGNVPSNTGPGTTNANSQFVDGLSLISSTPLPSNLQIILSQTITIQSVAVRSNTFTYGPSTVTITNNGPTS